MKCHYIITVIAKQYPHIAAIFQMMSLCCINGTTDHMLAKNKAILSHDYLGPLCEHSMSWWKKCKFWVSWFSGPLNKHYTNDANIVLLTSAKYLCVNNKQIVRYIPNKHWSSAIWFIPSISIVTMHAAISFNHGVCKSWYMHVHA